MDTTREYIATSSTLALDTRPAQRQPTTNLPPATASKTATRRPRHTLNSTRIWQLGAFISAVFAWWATARFSGIDPVILPSPTSVFGKLLESNICISRGAGSVRLQCGVQGYFLWQHLLATFERIAVGLGAGIVVGILGGWLLSSNARIKAVVDPYVNFLRALPPLGYIGLLIVWFGIGDLSKVLLLFCATFPPIVVSTMNGIERINEDWLRAATTWGASRAQILRHVLIPGATPEILSGIRLASGMAWTTIVAAEMNNGLPGIGGLAYVSGTQLDTALTIASIIVIGFSALSIDRALSLLEKRLTPWKGKVS